MRGLTLGLVIASTVVAGGLTIERAAAAPLSATGAAVPGFDGALVSKTDYFSGGRNYCWYYDGWHGPGWYWCGYAWRRGIGWGSPVWGWNGWAWRGPRFRPGYWRGRAPGRFYRR